MIKNADVVIAEVKSKLVEYVASLTGYDLSSERIPCFIHNGEGRNMGLQPDTAFPEARCFVCNETADIFIAANKLEGLPYKGPAFYDTVEQLATQLGVPFQRLELSPLDAEKHKVLTILRDIEAIFVAKSIKPDYIAKRNWAQKDILSGSISQEDVTNELLAKGWETGDFGHLIRTTEGYPIFGLDRVTFIYRDQYGRPYSFQSRFFAGDFRYINSQRNVFADHKIPAGLDTALNASSIILVEGIGDLLQLRRLNIQNSIALGTCEVGDNVIELLVEKGITSITLALDNDDAGRQGIMNFLAHRKSALFTTSIAKFEGKDLDEFLKNKSTPEFEVVTPFAFLIEQYRDLTPDQLAIQMVKVIAVEKTAIRRDKLIHELSSITGISESAIAADVSGIRTHADDKRRERLQFLVEGFARQASEDPDNVSTAMALLENKVADLDKEFRRNTLGSEYQTERFSQFLLSRENPNSTSFMMRNFGIFRQSMLGGGDATAGNFIIVGGRAHSGKTATTLNFFTDILVSDPDAMVIGHWTDDSLIQILPRIASVANTLLDETHPYVTMGMINNPKTYMPKDPAFKEALDKTIEFLKIAIKEERLVMFDSENGMTTSVVERALKHYRKRYPSRKIFCLMDNLHNYVDFPEVREKTERVTLIANAIKAFTMSYRCCVMATAEYRKQSGVKDESKLTLPQDDDLADARALTFRPTMILHVYNDLQDRRTHANIVKLSPTNEIFPRLLVAITKNKITDFKQHLFFDLNPKTTTLKEIPLDIAMQQAADFADDKDSGRAKIENGRVLFVNTDYDGEED